MKNVCKWISEWQITDLNGLQPQNCSDLPFSFKYGDKSSRQLLKKWQRKDSSRTIDKNRTEYKIEYTDHDSGLIVRCIAIEYHDFPTIEWTVYFSNSSTENSLILADIQALDISFNRKNKDEFILHYNRGDGHNAASYQPLAQILDSGNKLCFAPEGGRPTNIQFPYYNLQNGDEGMIIVLGWPGQWASEFTRDKDSGLNIRGGQEITHLKLYPGEEIRTPLVVLQFWEGKRIQAQNTWRRWMTNYNMPKIAGKSLTPFSSGFGGYYFPNLLITERGEKQFIDRYVEEKIIPDYWWIDAGWYECGEAWNNTGTWKTDRKRFPNGLREVIDFARSKGIAKTVVWFEPERVVPDSWLYENHPEWLLEDKKAELPTKKFILNLGDPVAWQWLIEHIDNILTEEGIDLYRQDFNMNSLNAWRNNDKKDRQGITEIKYITGYLTFWDELLRRHPNLLIDSCAAGGRRNDLETLRRSVPLWRSDCSWEPIGMQCHTYGLSTWFPFYGTGVRADDVYTFRSDMAPSYIMSWDMRKRDTDYNQLRKLMEQWRRVSDLYLGDFYPLTPYSLDNRIWMAWQFDRPDLAEGMVQVFRRPQSPYETARFKLKNLTPEARYSLINYDTLEEQQVPGEELMAKGLPVALTSQPDSAIFKYKLVE